MMEFIIAKHEGKRYELQCQEGKKGEIPPNEEKYISQRMRDLYPGSSAKAVPGM
jgi:hypothetical protein